MAVSIFTNAISLFMTSLPTTLSRKYGSFRKSTLTEFSGHDPLLRITILYHAAKAVWALSPNMCERCEFSFIQKFFLQIFVKTFSTKAKIRSCSQQEKVEDGKQTKLTFFAEIAASL